MNPYTDASFFSFFYVFISRLLHGFPDGMASDELQILVLLGVSLSSALVGTFLVLRKMTMLANSLSHTILLGIAFVYLAAFWGGHTYTPSVAPLFIASLLTGIGTTFLTNFLNHQLNLQKDASIGIVFSSLFSLAMIVVTLFLRDAHLGVEAIMGNVDALVWMDFQLVAFVFLLNGLLISLFFKEFLITTFDAGLAKSLGIFPTPINYLLMTQASFTIIAGFRAVGVFMVLAFLTALPLAARFLSHSLKGVLIIASCLGIVASFVGVALSRHILSMYGIPLSTGGVVVCVVVILFIFTAIYSQKRGDLLYRKEWSKQH